MAKISLAFMVCLFVVLPAAVSAQGNMAGQQVREQNRIREPEVPAGTDTPDGNQVQNQNQVGIQNQGMESQLQVETREQDALGKGPGDGQPGNGQPAVEPMNQAAIRVRQLLQTGEPGGIGDQVRQIARDQDQSQSRIREQVNRLDSRGRLIRMLAGTDFGAVKNLKAELVQNTVRIRQLEQLQNQLSNQGDNEAVRETIRALVAQNTALEERINSEERTGSMFGWLFRFMAGRG